MENCGNNTNIAKAKLNPFKHPARFHNLAAITFLPVNFIIADCGQLFIHTRNKKPGKFFYPHCASRITVNSDHIDGFSGIRWGCHSANTRRCNHHSHNTISDSFIYFEHYVLPCFIFCLSFLCRVPFFFYDCARLPE